MNKLDLKAMHWKEPTRLTNGGVGFNIKNTGRWKFHYWEALLECLTMDLTCGDAMTLTPNKL
jgi:hypothetical protein